MEIGKSVIYDKFQYILRTSCDQFVSDVPLETTLVWAEFSVVALGIASLLVRFSQIRIAIPLLEGALNSTSVCVSVINNACL